MLLRHPSLSLPLYLALPLRSNAVTFDCSHVRVGGQSYDFSALKGPHVVHHVENTPPTIENTTYTIDICEAMKPDKNIESEDQCPNYTRVCGITRSYHESDKYDPEARPIRVATIAGEFTLNAHRPLDPHWTRLKDSDSSADADKDGLRLEMKGGLWPLPKTSSSKPQKAFIELLCDPDRTGLDDEEEKNTSRKPASKADDGDEGDENEDEPIIKDPPNPDEGKALKFVSFKEEKSTSGSKGDLVGVLRLEWYTKYACEGEADKEKKDGADGSHWGFFTCLFMAVAAYLIFGSWLNYNRFGARGWDLLPHGDSIRDVPYLVKDWSRRVISTVQGGGSRDLGYIRV